MKAKLYIQLIKNRWKSPPPLVTIGNFLTYRLFHYFKITTLSFAPTSIVVYATKRCNFRCSFCHSMHVLTTSEESDLSLEQFNKILYSEHGKKALRIGFLGGEPFLNSNIFEMLKICKNERKITTIVTNAAVVHGQILEMLIKTPPDVLGISLYENNIKEVLKLIDSIDGKLLFWVQMSLDSQMIKGLSGYIDLLVEHNVKYLLLGNYHPITTQREDLVIYSDNEEYLKIESELKKKYSNKIQIFWPTLIPKSKFKKKCTMPFNYIHIDNNGNVGACCIRAPDGKRFGNLFNRNYWNGDYFIKLRNNILDNESPPLDECKNCDSLPVDLYGL